jgi:hypothetical protein
MRSSNYQSLSETDGTSEKQSKPRLYLPDGTVHHIRPQPPATSGSGSSPSLPRREIDFEQLPDGRLAELVEDPYYPKETLLAVGKNGTYKLVPSIPRNKEILVPHPRKEELLRFVTLPKGVYFLLGLPEFRVFDELPGLVYRFLVEHVALDLENLFVVSSFVLSTWFVDRFEVAPYLLVVGPPQSGKTTLLNVLALLCRRSWLVGDVSAAALYRTFAKIHPTLLLDESMTQAGLSDPALRHFLRVGTTRQGVARRGEVFDCYGAKVFAALEPPNDAALTSRCIIIPMSAANPDKKDLAEPAVRAYAEELQRALLQLRFDRWRSVQPVRIPGSATLRPRAQDLLACLAAAVPTEQGRDRLMTFFSCRVTDFEEDRRTVVSRLLNSVLLRLMHRPSEISIDNDLILHGIMVGDLTRIMNKELRLRGEMIPLSPEKVGHILTALGLTDRERTNCGMRLRMDLATRQRVHRNAKTYGQEKLCVDYGPQVADCPLCREVNGAESVEQAKEQPREQSQPLPDPKSGESRASIQQTSAEDYIDLN